MSDARAPHELAQVGRGWDGVAALIALGRGAPAVGAGEEEDHDDGEVADAAELARLAQLSRRSFLQLAGAGAAAAGLAACSSRPSREILPYANQPPELTPGVPLHYATALVEDGFATGVLVAAHEGRPTKIEGNPDHPASLGATRAIEQAAVLQLFDPDRVQAIRERGAPAPWAAIERMLDAAAASRGAGVHLLLEPTTSPVVIELLQRVRAALPAAGVTFWSPFGPRASLEGNRIAFGRALQTQLDLRTADVIVALDADLVAGHPMALAYARQLSDRRRVVDGRSPMSRLFVVEPGHSATGVIADHRFAVRGSQIEHVAAELLGAVLRAATDTMHAPPARWTGELARPVAHARARWLPTVAADLVAAAGRSVVVAGEHQPAGVHATVAAINAVLGNLGRTVKLSEPVVFEAGQASHQLADFTRALDRGSVSTLFVLGGNPAYTAPAELMLAGAIGRVANSMYLGLYDNETAHACRFVVPGLHELEHWGAARAYDGTLTSIQPLIEPLFAGRSVSQLLRRLLGDPPTTSDRDATRAAFARGAPGEAFDDVLVRGAVADSAAREVTVEVAWGALAPVIVATGARTPPLLELAIRPHPFVHDGRYTNNPWLLELPEPVTKLSWNHAAQLSPATAAELGVDDGDVLALATIAGAIALEVPAIIVPGHADGAITLHTGFGRDGDERTARGIGVNAFQLWTTSVGLTPAISAAARGGKRALAITQVRLGEEDRPVALGGTLGALAGQPLRDELAHNRGSQPSIYRRRPGEAGRAAAGAMAQWAMQIDLTTCTGCSACVMACAAENNAPVVGEQQVRRGRDMHWLRIDRYYVGTGSGDGADAQVVVQPMACQHCEQAPCEYVCPVEATTHSPDGLNEMTYNRCVGTRFCANNCPYKVRRFNWFDFKEHSGLRIAARNPDVTVRDRGVMEKCTYCVQRIRRAEIDARIADRGLAEGDVRTACQQACPTQAITFGSLTDAKSAVVEQRRRPHSHAVLGDQGTAPRTQYLARIRNPNGALS